MVAVTALYGREKEQRLLLQFLDEPAHGRPELLVVGGQTGIGKSRLLLDAAGRARSRGFAVHQLGDADLYAPAPPRALREALGTERPLFVIDDAGAGAAEALLSLVREQRPPSARPVSVLLARSAGSAGADRSGFPSWEDARSEQGVTRTCLELEPLGEAAVRELVGGQLGVAPQPALLDVMACANGNPRLIVEFLEGLREEGRIGPDGDLVRLTPGRLPDRVRATVAGLLRDMSPESVQLLRVGTLLGRTFQLSQAVAMLNTSTAALLPALEETLAMGVLRLAEDGVTFEHPLLWRAVYEAIPTGVRSALLEEARRVAARPVLPPHDLVALGRGTGARRERPGPAGGAAGLPGALDTLLASGYAGSALVLARNALGRPMPDHEAAELRRVLLDLLMVGVGGSEVLRGDTDPAAGPAPDLAEDGSQEALRAAATALARIRWTEGDAEGALRSGAEAAEQPLTPDTAAARAYPRIAHARRLIAVGEIPAARALIGRLLEETSARDLATFGPAAGLALAEAHVRAGELDDADGAARAALAAADRQGLHTLAAWASATLARVALRRADAASAEEHLERLRGFAPHLTPLAAVPVAWLGLLRLAAGGESRAAAQLLRGTHQALPSLGTLHFAEPGAAAWFVRLSRAAGDPAPGQEALRTVERLAAANLGIAGLQAAASHARALFECDPEGLRRAAAEHTDAWGAATAAEDLRALLDARGQADQRVEVSPGSRSHLIRENPGRCVLVTRPESAAPAPDAAAGWEGLGETERTIALRVADGLTNRQVSREVQLSPHTVNYYLRRIYGKLGIRSRVELTRLVLAGTERQRLP
ncbi:helix-turn-helix transcriptional regulator [Streptomyces sp. H34-S4]|uniref:helix-turn-helix transcriptional regulator n=1 Tax=Streptomyces sp. H34-S4 TaxID=2996463 RepID=UPI002270F25C|nr:LuxR family transcriptional regulator [Streptomyces sp. H34-S4]MCY0938204.1 LuxR C-terminal-related transcriptional regulator [Streptomyces sp. H34-S4]